MATFSIEPLEHVRIRKDGTYPIYIRVTHNRKVKRVYTNLFVEQSKVTKKFNIKDSQVLDKAEDIIREFRIICNDKALLLDAMSVDELVQFLKLRMADGNNWRLDFIEYGRKKAAEMSPGTGGIYITALRALCRFIKRDTLDISEINRKFIGDFENFLRTEPSQRGTSRNQAKGGRAISLYLERMRALYNIAKAEFNDEDFGIIRIPWSPFKNYKIKPQPLTAKRALLVEDIQKLIDYTPPEDAVREILARDCFILSFALIGMNSADLYTCEKTLTDVLVYFRAKTRSRRADLAEMHVKIPDVVRPLVKKYSDTDKQFSFHRKYANFDNLTRAINTGLKNIAEHIGIDSFTLYAARHSWATIARSSSVGIDKYTVHEALNHVDPDMKVTDIYIQKDWSVIWNANDAVLAMFDWSRIA